MSGAFPVSARIEVRWRDLDALGHVNNAVYFTYFETARVKYAEEVLGIRSAKDVDFILASIQCDFLSQVSSGERLEVGIRIPAAGQTSFDFEYEARSLDDGRPVARARSTQVLFDYATNRKKPITAEWLAMVAEKQGSAPAKR